MSKQKSKVQDLFSVIDFDKEDVVEKTCEEKKSDCENVKDEKLSDKKVNNPAKSKNDMKQKEYKKFSVEEVKEATIKYFGGD